MYPFMLAIRKAEKLTEGLTVCDKRKLCTMVLRRRRPQPRSPDRPTTPRRAAVVRHFSSNRAAKNNKTGEDEWNDAWETAWLPDDLSGKSSRAPWESDVNFSLSSTAENPQTTPSAPPEEIDAETQAFVEDMNDNWDHRKGKSVKSNVEKNAGSLESSSSSSSSSSLYSLENIKRDYRLTKQKIHAGLWVKEIEKFEESKLGNSISGSDDIEKLLDSASEIYLILRNNDFWRTQKFPALSSKNKPDGWETISKTPNGNVWDMSQREEDILVQEFERRIAFNKFQIASFIKTHIFSRRRPIDGWKYMIEVIGPNAKKGKGSVSRLPAVSDEATQPFREEKTTFPSPYSSSKGR
ncbi:hypothetical protein Salat_1298300 [Sesamum alatum]|uniref:Mucin-like protein n=1 Tax=Sesamum alatum TaxID=300844 RepID=A0AAE1YHK4_9LAMI|nr:hypothetical protein Salat_1298300 [Sesamum alatum]